MTNKEFLVEVQKVCHLDMPLCLSLMGSLQKVLAKAAVDQVPVAMTGLGMFTSHKHPEYIQENKSTGSMTLYPPRISYRMTTEVADDAIHCSVLLAQFASIPEEQVSSFIDAFVSVINEHLLSGEEIEVPGVGYFQNILTHHSEIHHVSYVPSDQMKELVNAPFSCFEPMVISEGTVVAKEDFFDIHHDELDAMEKSEENISTDVKVNNCEIKGPSIEVQTVENSKIDEFNVSVSKDEVKDESLKENEQHSDVAPIVETPSINDINGENQKSSNWSLYISLGVILCACGFVLWLIFGDSTILWNDQEPQEAVVVIVQDDNQLLGTANRDEDVLDTIDDGQEIASEKNLAVSEIEKDAGSQAEIKIEVPKIEENNAVSLTENSSVVSDYHRMLGPDGKPVKVVLKPGERLTLIALEHFGDKAFWPYIFDVNSDKLKAPNLVQAGMSLYLPDPAYYSIDANDAKSLQKAKARGAQLLK